MSKKKKKKFSLKKMFEGFTLVELLAVIVILAIIMIIAIPSVMGSLEVARRKTFGEFITKAYSKFQDQLIQDKDINGIVFPSDTTSVYYTLDDLDLRNTGNYYGYFEYINVGSTCFNLTARSFYSDPICSGQYIIITMMDSASDLTYNYVGVYGSSGFTADIDKVDFYEGTEGLIDYYYEHGYFPDVFFRSGLECEKSDLTEYINEEVARRTGELGSAIRITELK